MHQGPHRVADHAGERSACNVKGRGRHAEERSPGVRPARLMRSCWTSSSAPRKDKANGIPPGLLGAAARTRPPTEPQEPARAGQLPGPSPLQQGCSPHGPLTARMPPRSRVLFEDVFAGHSLSRNHWNPYICDNSSNGSPWLAQPSVAVASSAIGVRTASTPRTTFPRRSAWMMA